MLFRTAMKMSLYLSFFFLKTNMIFSTNANTYIAHAPEALVRQIGLTQSDSEAKQKQDRQRAYHRPRRQEACRDTSQ